MAALKTRQKPTPTIRDLIAEDADVICVNGFRIYPIGREIVKGEYFKLNDAVVQEHATFFAVCIPVSQVLEQGR